jgi:hypothetical protein
MLCVVFERFVTFSVRNRPISCTNLNSFNTFTIANGVIYLKIRFNGKDVCETTDR